MTKAFVFGKFLPFHKGHEAMIQFAWTKCDFLTVLVCCSDKESIPDTVRVAWIEQTFEGQKDIEVRAFNYLESELPNTSESSRSVSKIWADRFQTLLPGYTLLVTSEPYGDFVADFMGIQHIPFDPSRRQYPVSATALRHHVIENWAFLPDSVKPYYALKVVLLGTESTGKSTLAAFLSKYFRCSLVREAGRELIADSNDFSPADLLRVAEAHAQSIRQAALADSPLVIIDTDIHITKSYSRFTFGQELEVSDDIYEANKAHLYLYLNNDVPYFQDGTRLSESDRNLLDSSHRQVLAEHGIAWVEVRGDWAERERRAVEEVGKALHLLNVGFGEKKQLYLF